MATVLIVDDTDAIRWGLSLLLRQNGYKPVLAADGFEALELIDIRRPDLILLDISMPGMDGLTVLEQIRERPDCESIPVLMYSAVDDDLLRRRAARLGADFVRKGAVSWDELSGCIRSRLSATPPGMTSSAMTMTSSSDAAGELGGRMAGIPVTPPVTYPAYPAAPNNSTSGRLAGR